MAFKDWHFTAMEEASFMDTNTGLICRVANYLAGSPNDTIKTEEFREACIVCGVDPDSFRKTSAADLDITFPGVAIFQQ